MARFLFVYKKKRFLFNIKKCKGYFSKASGLMFRKKSPALLFIFKKKNKQGIHSFFCVKFIAVWFNENRIISVKLVKPWKFYVKPNKKFDKLLEIPENDSNFKKMLLLIGK